MSLAEECAALVAGNSAELVEQNECLHESQAGKWWYTPVYGAHANFAEHEGAGGVIACNPATPAACRAVEQLKVHLGDSLVRVGYSVVDAGAHIRPHWGPTNTILKVHVGLTVPKGEGSGANKGARCTSITVAGEEREWKEGSAILFDDSYLHFVWNNCTSFRSVLQIVVKHPRLKSAGVGQDDTGGSAGNKEEL